MVDLKLAATGHSTSGAPGAEVGALDDEVAVSLLTADDPEAIAELAAWLKVSARTFPTVVAQAVQEGLVLSPEAAREVLDAMAWRASASGETTLFLLSTCLDVMARRLSGSLSASPNRTTSDQDDVLVDAAVLTLTSKRPARCSETSVDCLAEAGPGGALVLARAFDAVRGRLKLRIVRRLKPTDVLQLNDNVVASLTHSLSVLAEELEGAERSAANRLLVGLGGVRDTDSSAIGTGETLEKGTRVFHASWGVGTVIATDDESVTIDFGSAGTRTLLRSLATLRRASHT